MEASLVVAEVMEAKGGAQNKINEEKLAVAVVGNGGASKIASAESKKKKKNKNRIHVSNTKKPFYFYINLAKKYIKQYKSVELSALGTAIPTVITISEFLKRDGLAVEKKISISTVSSKDDKDGQMIGKKSQIEIALELAAEVTKTSVEKPSEKADVNKA
ncbi:uncharacterized protein At2g34160 [Ziziphus jujuba]|uniref:Uncharacterized protein At2g34160 n=1 Tax=Ziziphus jujuba TaxID=326968 RepID=A0A6P4A3R2_ZIZJJ|nr:uncharacterized protein At2g34160 [Ziziphus jujuba]